MKKSYKISLLMVILLSVIFAVYYTFPKSLNITFNGIQYKINNQNDQQQVTIEMKGSLRKRILKEGLFRGSVVVIRNHYNFIGAAHYIGDNQYSIRNDETHITYGLMYAEEPFKKITICIDDDNGNWNSENGTMISAPSKDRIEALNVSNDLMKKVLIKELK